MGEPSVRSNPRSDIPTTAALIEDPASWGMRPKHLGSRMLVVSGVTECKRVLQWLPDFIATSYGMDLATAMRLSQWRDDSSTIVWIALEFLRADVAVMLGLHVPEYRRGYGELEYAWPLLTSDGRAVYKQSLRDIETNDLSLLGVGYTFFHDASMPESPWGAVGQVERQGPLWIAPKFWDLMGSDRNLSATTPAAAAGQLLFPTRATAPTGLFCTLAGHFFLYGSRR